MTVGRIQTSCDCTTAYVEAPTRATLPLVVAPGQKFGIRVLIDREKIHSGPNLKSIFVFALKRAEPAATLQMVGIVQPAVVFAPDALDFGHVTSGEAASQVVTVALDPNLVSSYGEPHLVCSNPDIQVEPQNARPDRLSDKDAQSARSQKHESISASLQAPLRSYKLTLPSHPRLGLIDGTVALISGEVNSPRSEVKVFGSIPVIGEVVGQIATSPKAVVLNVLTPGKPAKQLVTIKSSIPASLQNLRVSSSSPYLSTRLMPVMGEDSPDTVSSDRLLLEVTAEPTTPVGILETEVTLTWANNARLRLPVAVSVMPLHLTPKHAPQSLVNSDH